MSNATWLRDALLELRESAKLEGLEASEEALRVAIIQVSLEQNIATLLSIKDLLKGVRLQGGSASANIRTLDEELEAGFTGRNSKWKNMNDRTEVPGTAESTLKSDSTI